MNPVDRLATIRSRQRAPALRRIVVHGASGMGRVALACDMKKPLFVLAGRTMKLVRPGVSAFPKRLSYDEVLRDVNALKSAAGRLAYKTLVIHSVSDLDWLIQVAICSRHGWSSIQEAPYGQGFAEWEAEWRRFMDAVDRVERMHSLTIVLLCDTRLMSVHDVAAGGEYESARLALSSRASSVLEAWADVVAYMHYPLAADEEGDRRWLRTAENVAIAISPSPAWMAKCDMQPIPGDARAFLTG